MKFYWRSFTDEILLEKFYWRSFTEEILLDENAFVPGGYLPPKHCARVRGRYGSVPWLEMI